MKKELVLGLTGVLAFSGLANADQINGNATSGKQVNKKQIKSSSTDMKKIIERLESDYDFIGAFLDDPEKILAAFDLKDEERKALSSRDLNELMNLGFSEKEVAVAMSGTHHGGSGMGSGTGV